MTTYYVAQERAMAPGISGKWPEVIRAPHTRHGRLRRVDDKTAASISAAPDLLAVCKRILETMEGPFGWDYEYHLGKGIKSELQSAITKAEEKT